MNKPGRRYTQPAFALSLTFACCLCAAGACLADPVPVLHPEGLVHGFLVLKDLEGKHLANGDLIQTSKGASVTTRLVFHFADGSLYDETTVFSQTRQFRLITDHLVEKGTAFPQPLDMTIDTRTGKVEVHYTDDHGQAKVEAERMKLPADLANGLVLTLLKNVRAQSPDLTVGYVAATPKPRLVRLKIASAGADPFSTGGQARKAAHYVVKVDIGGFAGLVAPLVGKQPPDSHVWVLGGEAPAFVKAEQPMYVGGPLWRIELVTPAWARDTEP